MKYAVIASCALFAGNLPAAVQAASVYPGCAVPSLKAGHHTFYVDPAKGSAGGDGSILKPWRTLAEVVSAGKVSTMTHKKAGGTDPLTALNPNGAVKAGDVIMLMSGNHGSVTIENSFNTDFITVMAAPGQTPVVSDLTFISSAKWVFQGIKFQSLDVPTSGNPSKRSSTPLVWVTRNDYFGASSDFVFDNDSFSSSDSTAQWSDNDWLDKTRILSISINSPCVSVTNSSIYNVLNGIMVGGPKSLIQGNTIRSVSNDGIDFTSSDIAIRGNTIKDSVDLAYSPYHPDGIQGWSNKSNGNVITNRNIVIEDNNISKSGDSNKKGVTGMQGISIYDGSFDNLIVQNNVVVSNLWNGIALNGIQNSKILNNTVVASEPVKHQSWIGVGTSSDGVKPYNVIVRNNISPTLTLPNQGVTYDHNVVGGMYTIINNGKATYQTNSDNSKSISVVPNIVSQFVNVNFTAGSYDLRLKSSSSVRGIGSAAMMPPFDIVGRARTNPVDPGAYAK